MTDQQWAAVWKVFNSVQSLPAQKRAEAFRAAGLDDSMLQEVQALLELSACCTTKPYANESPQEQESAPEFSAGDEIGRYTIIGRLGAGAFGKVYAARDRQLHRDVAIKALHRASESSADQAVHEARTASALNHPNILTVYDTFTEAGLVSIVTELVDGPSLRQSLAEHSGPLPVGDAVRIARQIASALQEAHGAGIVHRDVKPENILLRRKDSLVKLVDFGVATVRNALCFSRAGGRKRSIAGLGCVLARPRPL